MNRALKKVSAMLVSVMLALTSVPYSYAATVDSGSETSYSVQNKAKTIAKAPASGGDSYAAVLRADKVANDAQTKTQDGYSQQVETKLSEADGNISASYFEQDKYLSDPTGEKNGQSTYNVTLENAYVGPQIQQQAPDGQDIIIIEDASSSMSGHVSAENEAFSTFASNIKATNLQRIENAMNGEYVDINPSGKTRSQIKQEMIDKNHLLRVVGVESFNDSTVLRSSTKTYLLTDAEVSSLVSAAALKDGQTSHGGDLADLTRTDYALQDISGKYNLISDASRTSVVLITDGAPYDWNNSITNGVLMSSGATNNALRIATNLKAQGVTIFTAYAPWDANGNTEDYNQAVKKSDVSILAPGGKITDDRNFAAIFMSIVSSDYTNGQLGTKSGSTMFDNTVTYSSTENGFGKYSKIIWDADGLAKSIGAIAKSVDVMTIQSALRGSGYASLESYILDDISHPFGLNGTEEDIKVYQVPRVPKNLDSTGHPANASNVTAFTWGEKEDITDQVNVSYIDNRIKITGYNYELHALTIYDHDLTLPQDQQPRDPSKYEKGDYGYKLVVEFPIYAKYSFGGNDIETNDSTTSGFYPSKPGADASAKNPKWETNSSLNPNGNSYVALYPVPTVDLKVNYAIVSDSTTLYAPQTEKLKDLVTNPSSDPDQVYIFDVGDASVYHKLYEDYKQAMTDVDVMQTKYDAAFEKFSKDSSAENFSAVNAAQSDLRSAIARRDEAKEALAKPQNYIPNGENNAYVDIVYTLTSPSGKVIGTMSIPHGTNTSDAPDGNGKVHWDFTDGADANITESGKYKITATVTPVKTTREESYTGSSDADETCSAKTYTANPTAYIYVLQVKVKDTAKRPGATLDFIESGYDLFAAAKSDDWKDVHFVETKWLPLNDKTPESKSANEPGSQSKGESDLKKIATGKAPIGTVTIANGENVSGTDTKYVSKDAKDGSYIPAAIEIHRIAGSMEKTDPTSEKDNMKDHLMSDDDHLYGDKSSVVWVNDCKIVDDCSHHELADARNRNDGGKTTGANITRFLVHIFNVYLPDIEKETSTPSILPGEDISWNVTIHNDNEEENKEHKTTKAQMLDVLPYQSDGRTNPNDNTDTGSSFGGDLYFKTISVDCSSATEMADLYENGAAKFYYTEDAAVRTATREDWYSGKISWTAVIPSVNGNAVSFTVPQSAVAIKSDTTLQWNEKVVFHMTANIKNPDNQRVRDTYINQALIGNDDEVKDSNPVVTTVVTLSISGNIWYDDNRNGQMDGTEERSKDISVSLYRERTNDSTEAVALGGINLEKVYNSKEETVPTSVTDKNGYFSFEFLTPGTYYVVATEFSEDYKITPKQAEGTDDALNSKAEEAMPAGQTAWIKQIVVSDKSVEHQNIGLVIQKGTLTIQKAMENGELYYPSSMTDEQKKDLVKGFIFKLTNNATGEEYTSTLHMDMEHTDGVSAVIEDLPLGTYTLKEESSLGYDVKSMAGEEGNFSYNDENKTATVVISAGNTEVRALVVNKIKEPTPGVYPGESVANHIGTSKPINFAVEYAHGDINDTSAVSYTFKESDFANMTVWYDDGSYRDFTGMYKQNADGSVTKLSDDRLKFSEVTLTPATITNEKNTSESGNKVDVKTYYTERSKTLSDKFEVGVNLAPVYKFTVVFHANGSTIGGADTNEVRFAYNDSKAANDIISGIYKLPDAHDGWTYAGWNTASDGSGGNYDSISALNEIGKTKSQTSRIDLYAHWTTTVTFNANGGTNYMNGGAVNNPYTITWDVHRRINSAGMSAQRAATSTATFAYKGWYTTPITVTAGSAVTGTDIDNYGIIEGPVTFYAAWRMGYTMQKYHYTGGAQSYTAPVSGTYIISLYGAKGGQDGNNQGGNGGYLKGSMYLQAGQTVTIYVGGHGNLYYGYTAGGYNGGGAGYGSGSGGGCTDIYLGGTRIAAAGGGGGDCDSYGGNTRKHARLCGTSDNITGGKTGGTAFKQDGSGSAGGGGGWNGGRGAYSWNDYTGWGGTNGYNGSYFTKIDEGRDAKGSGSEAPDMMASTSWDPIRVYNGFASILPPAD